MTNTLFTVSVGIVIGGALFGESVRSYCLCIIALAVSYYFWRWKRKDRRGNNVESSEKRNSGDGLEEENDQKSSLIDGSVFWVIYNSSMKPVAQFELAEKEEALAMVEKLSEQSPHFIQKRKA